MENVNTQDVNVGDINTEDVVNTGEEKTLDLLDLMDKDENIKSQFQSEVDRMITKAIQTRDKKHQEELAKEQQRAKMTAEEIQHEKERELAEKEQQLQQYELGLKKVEYFRDNNLDMSLIDFISVESEDDIEGKATQLMDAINNVVSKQVKEKLKENGYSTPKDNGDSVSNVSLEDLKGRSVEEINQLWNNVEI